MFASFCLHFPRCWSYHTRIGFCVRSTINLSLLWLCFGSAFQLPNNFLDWRPSCFSIFLISCTPFISSQLCAYKSCIVIIDSFKRVNKNKSATNYCHKTVANHWVQSSQWQTCQRCSRWSTTEQIWHNHGYTQLCHSAHSNQWAGGWDHNLLLNQSFILVSCLWMSSGLHNCRVITRNVSNVFNVCFQGHIFSSRSSNPNETYSYFSSIILQNESKRSSICDFVCFHLISDQTFVLVLALIHK